MHWLCGRSLGNRATIWPKTAEDAANRGWKHAPQRHFLRKYRYKKRQKINISIQFIWSACIKTFTIHAIFLHIIDAKSKRNKKIFLLSARISTLNTDRIRWKISLFILKTVPLKKIPTFCSFKKSDIPFLSLRYLSLQETNSIRFLQQCTYFLCNILHIVPTKRPNSALPLIHWMKETAPLHPIHEGRL